MKTIHKLLATLAILLSATSCVGDYEMPDLPAPTYDGPEANITIAQYRERFGSAASGTLIEDDLILRATVTGDDEGGNIYKQLIIEDGTGGISVQIDANNLYNIYHVGQEIYLDLKGLYTSVYGGELQIGYADGDRIPSDTFDEHAHRNGWPLPDNVKPKEVFDISTLNDDVNGNTGRNTLKTPTATSSSSAPAVTATSAPRRSPSAPARSRASSADTTAPGSSPSAPSTTSTASTACPSATRAATPPPAT